MIPGWLIEAAAELAISTGKKIWSKANWSKDRAKVRTVESQVRELMVNAGSLFLHGVPGDPDGIMRPLLERFEGELVKAGVPATDAHQIAEQESKTIRTLIIEPQRRQFELGGQISALQSDLEALRSRAEKLEREDAARAREMASAVRLASICIAVAIVALLLAIVALVRVKG